MPTKEKLNMTRIARLLAAAIDEDLGTGDVTSEAIVAEGAMASGRFETREDAVIAGLPLVEHVFRQVAKKLAQQGRKVDPAELRFEAAVCDGDRASWEDTIAVVTGPALVLLSGERLSLNFIQRLSGIATMTSKYVKAVEGTAAKILDTRKTTPGWRYLEKYAVRVGGGVNHRIGLYDMILIKDNHLEIAAQRWPKDDPVTRAIAVARAQAPDGMLIEVETANLDQVRSAVEAGADIIMFDNMFPDEMAEAVRLVKSAPRRILTEASGGVTMDTVRQIAETGVDRISIGALTHSARALDIALEM